MEPVVIVGAGMAGASCALALARAGRHSIILEARERIGGRVHTLRKDGYTVDLGASNVHGYQREDNPTKILAKQIGIECEISHPPQPPVYFAPDGSIIPSEQVTTLKDKTADLISRHLKKHQNNNSEDIGLGESVLPEIRKLHPHAEALARFAEINSLRLEQFSSRHYQTEKGFAGTDALPRGGYQAMAEKAFAESKATVKLNTQVTKIEEQENSVKVSTANGETYEAPHCVVTVPLPILRDGDITFTPVLPKERQNALNNATYGTLNKICLIYPSAWWQQDPASFIFLQNSDKHAKLTSTSSLDDILACSFLMAQNFMSCYLDKVPVLLVYCAGQSAEMLENFTDEEIGQAAHNFLAAKISAESSKTIDRPSSCTFTRWKKDPYAKGAHTSPMSFGRGTPEDLRSLGQPLWDGKLRFAGEHTDYDLRGSIPGAIFTGQREARAVLEQSQ